jgi:hypothetical protein
MVRFFIRVVTLSYTKIGKTVVIVAPIGRGVGVRNYLNSVSIMGLLRYGEEALVLVFILKLIRE